MWNGKLFDPKVFRSVRVFHLLNEKRALVLRSPHTEGKIDGLALLHGPHDAEIGIGHGINA